MLQRFRRSFVLKVGAFAAALAALVALAAGAISYEVARSQMKEMLLLGLDTQARIIAAHLSAELKNISENLSAMAANTLMANALADSGGRDNYLRPFLQSYREIASTPVSMVLCDFQGKPLAENPVSPFTPFDPAMLRDVVESGKPRSRLERMGEDTAITLAWPVLYANTGLPEGALAYQFRLSELSPAKFAGEQALGSRIMFKKSDAGPLGPVAPLPGNALTSRAAASLPEALTGWTATVEVWEDGQKLTSELWTLARGYIVIGLLGMMLVVPLSMGSVRWLSSRLKHLENVANEVIEKRSLELRFPEGGYDEISSLGRMFNLMLDELNRANQEIRSDASREVRRHAERLRRILSSTLEGYVRIDLQSRRVVEVNEAFRRMAADFIRDWDGSSVPVFLEGGVQQAEELETAQAWMLEDEVGRNGGNGFAFLAKCSLDVAPDGMRQLAVFLTDITGKKKAEEALTVAAESQRILLDYIQTQVWYLTDEQTYGAVNEAHAAFIGMGKENVAFKSMYEFLPREAADVCRQSNSEVFATGKPVRSEERAPNAAGEPRLLSILKSPKLRADGTVEYVVCSAEDITERKRAEELLQVTNTQLTESVRSLEQSNQARGLLNRMNELLLAAQGREDAYEVVRFCAPQLFLGISGALSVLDPDSGRFETVARWGEHSVLEDQWNMDDCWGMRMGGIHELSSSGSGLPCRHFSASPDRGSLCIPLTVQNKTLGLLWTDFAGQPAARSDIYPLAVTMADSIKLALSNIELRKALHDQAIRDVLTGLYNRRHFLDMADRELARARRTGSPLCLGMVDIDHFKRLNDTFGHDAGDQVLRELGMLLAGNVRSTDIPFRLGGEEFVVMFTDTDQAGAAKRMEELRSQLEAKRITHNGVPLGVVTMSAGVAQFPLHGQDREALLQAADTALYRAKEAGRNNVQVAS